MMDFFYVQSVIIGTGILFGIFLIISILRIKDPFPPKNVLVTFLAVVIVTLIADLIVVQGYFSTIPHSGLFMDYMYFLYGPLLYLFVVKFLNQRPVFADRPWLHFVLPAVHIISMSEYIFSTPERFYELIMTGSVWQFPYDQSLAVVSIGLYVALSWKSLSKYQKVVESERKRMLSFLFAVLIGGLILWVNLLAVDVWGFDTGRVLRKYTDPWSLFPLITIALGYYAISEPRVFRKLVVPYEGSNLSEDQVLAIAQKLQKAMVDEKLYRNPNLKIEEVAKSIDVSMKDLSRVINQEFGSNYFDFVNQFRIEEFKNIATPDNLKNRNLIALAFDVGFNSKSAFNKAFKRLTGTTPSHFLKNET